MSNHEMRLDRLLYACGTNHLQGRHLKMPTEHHNHLNFEYKVFDHLILITKYLIT